MKYKFKLKPEDFVVEEIPKFDAKQSGKYLVFMLKKRNWNTYDAIRKIASKLRTKERFFNVAGIKDKNAITTQFVSIRGVSWSSLERLKIKDLTITPLGYIEDRLKLGQMEGNKFTIRVRGLDGKGKPMDFLENYYDDQRFGGRNHLLGRCIVKKEFSKACLMLRLKVENNDYIGALRKLGKKILRLYVNAYQSYLFNESMASYLKKKYKNYSKADYTAGQLIFSDEKIKNEKWPILGFLTEFENKEIEAEYRKLMEEDDLKREDFIIRQIPELSSEGNERDMFIDIKFFNVEYSENDKGKIDALVKFILPTGAYATMVLKKMFSK